MRSETAIRVENLSKKYTLRPQARGEGLRHAIQNALTVPIRKLGSRNGSSTASLEADSAYSAKRPDIEEFWALKNVNFEIKRGDAVGIIGRNGAGKSTLLKVLSRITEPTSGRIGINGRVASLLEVGTGFHPELTGRENIFLNGAILGMTKTEIRTRFDEIVAFAEIEKFLDSPVKHYSSGMYVRLAFAVAAHLEAEILIVDEVLAVGDMEFQKKCLGKMDQVGRGGRTVLFVSHNTTAIEQLCQRVILIEQGAVKADSSNIRSILATYLHGDNRVKSAVWHATSTTLNNPWFCPERFAITTNDGHPVQGPVRNDHDIWVEITASLSLLDPSLTVGYALYSESGDLLYWSYQSDTESTRWPRLSKGRCKLRSQIPKRFLNEGSYRLELIGGLHMREWLFEPGKSPTVTFDIFGGLSNSPLWNRARPGVLAPEIPWETISCD